MRYALAVLALLLPGVACAEESLSKKCTSDEASAYRDGGGDRKLYVYDVENTCDFPIRCELNITIVNAFGINTDRKVMSIAPKTHGSLVMWVKAYGGMLMRARECRQV